MAKRTATGLILTDAPFASYASQIKETIEEAKGTYNNVRIFRRAAKLIVERSADKPKQRFVAHAATKILLREWNALTEYFDNPVYSPWNNPVEHEDTSDLDIWCVAMHAPDDEQMRLVYKFAPGVEGQGWEAALMVVHRNDDNYGTVTAKAFATVP